MTADETTFSILAVGSFPQTSRTQCSSLEMPSLSVSSLLDRFLRHGRQAPAREAFGTLSVSSLLDRFLRRLAQTLNSPELKLSVSSLLDRFLRLPVECCSVYSKRPFSILAVGSFPQTIRFHRPDMALILLSVSSLLDRFLRRSIKSQNAASDTLSVSSLLDRFLRPPQSLPQSNIVSPFSILAVGSFPQTKKRHFACCDAGSFSILAVGSFPQTR